MNTIVVRYRPRSDSADENQALIEQVFDQLAGEQPDGLRYVSLRLDDGTFIHIAETSGETNPLGDLETFRAFSSTVAERCAPGEGPNAQPAVVVGSYRVFD